MERLERNKPYVVTGPVPSPRTVARRLGMSKRECEKVTKSAKKAVAAVLANELRPTTRLLKPMSRAAVTQAAKRAGILSVARP
jgi:hypothetical protein